jgi:hypothetical protein
MMSERDFMNWALNFSVWVCWMDRSQEPVERYGNVDAGFRDPSSNGWMMIQARSERI